MKNATENPISKLHTVYTGDFVNKILLIINMGVRDVPGPPDGAKIPGGGHLKTCLKLDHLCKTKFLHYTRFL